VARGEKKEKKAIPSTCAGLRKKSAAGPVHARGKKKRGAYFTPWNRAERQQRGKGGEKGHLSPFSRQGENLKENSVRKKPGSGGERRKKGERKVTSTIHYSTRLEKKKRPTPTTSLEGERGKERNKLPFTVQGKKEEASRASGIKKGERKKNEHAAFAGARAGGRERKASD